jgi:hypothetical protein
MTLPENTKPQSAKINEFTRCQHRRPSGRRCRLAVTAPGAPFCFPHTQEFNKADSLDHKAALLTNHQGFQTAQGINHSLGNLYKLLAANYISPRRAAVLAYINSLQLRTLSAIDADNAAGITDPTAPKQGVLLQSSSTQVPAPDDRCGASAPPSNAPSQAGQGWDASIPEPDPAKKPS